MEMTRARAMEVLARSRHDEVVVTGPGGASGALYVQGHVAPTLYNMEMGYAAPTCLGIALARPDRRVIAVEGDGSLVAGSPALVTIARAAPGNLTVVVLDNGVFETIGSGKVSVGSEDGVSLVDLARASGIPSSNVVACDEDDAFAAALRATREAPGPWVIVVRVVPAAPVPGVPRPVPGLDVIDSAIELRQVLARTGSEEA